MSRAKYHVPLRVRLGKPPREVSQALGNSRVSGFREGPGEHFLRNRVILVIVFAITCLIGLYGVVF